MISINEATDILLAVDVQNDFINGSLAVPNGAEVVPVINKYMKKIKRRMFSKDMHPEGHCSFKKQGGPWPDHCIMGTRGSYLHSDLDINPNKVMLVTKGILKNKDAYSAFDDTGLGDVLPGMNVKRLFICGLATDYCVKATVLDALKFKNIKIYLLLDAIRAVDVNPGDGSDAIFEMCGAGANPIKLDKIA